MSAPFGDAGGGGTFPVRHGLLAADELAALVPLCRPGIETGSGHSARDVMAAHLLANAAARERDLAAGLHHGDRDEDAPRRMREAAEKVCGLTDQQGERLLGWCLGLHEGIGKLGMPPDVRARLGKEDSGIRLMLYTDAPPVPDALLRVMLFLTGLYGPPHADPGGGHYEWPVSGPDDEEVEDKEEFILVTFGPDAEMREGLVEVMVFGTAAYAAIGCCVEHGVAHRNAGETIAAWDDEAKRKRAEEAAAASKARKRPKVVPLRPNGGGERDGA